MSERINAIPDPTADPQSLLMAVRAIKEVVEGLTGQRPGTAGRSPRVYIQAVRPNAQTGALLSEGDFWIAKGTDKLFFWDGRLWQPIQPHVAP